MLAPLDMCHQAPLTQLFIDQLQDATDNQPVVDFVSHLLQRRLDSANAEQKSEYLYDLSTAWFAVADDCHIERRYGTMSVISQTDQNPVFSNLQELRYHVLVPMTQAYQNYLLKPTSGANPF